MAGINVDSGGGGGRKNVNAELILVPMIDLLMVTVAFLLVTAVWSQMSRVESSANVPGDPRTEPTDVPPAKRLHVREKSEGQYELTWKTGKESSAPIVVDAAAQSLVGSKSKSEKLPALADAIAKEWKKEGSHRDATDRAFDEAVVHTDNEIPYSRLVAILDAVKQPTRSMDLGGKSKETSAFAVTFAVD